MFTQRLYPRLQALKSDAPLPTVCHVRIHGVDDDALLVNGKVLLSFEPAVDQQSCLEISKDLATLLQLPLNELTVDVSRAIDDWNWGEIEAFLSRGCHGERYAIIGGEKRG